MNVVITENYNELSECAAQTILSIVKNYPYAVLGLATGTTPLGLYKLLAQDHKKISAQLIWMNIKACRRKIAKAMRILCVIIYSIIWT